MKGVHKVQLVDGQTVTIEDDLIGQSTDHVFYLSRILDGLIDDEAVCVVPLSALLAYVVTGYQR